MFAESDLLPLSALQHLLFCQRQCALIHVEQLWVENRFTAEGRVLHERADSGASTLRGGIRCEYGLHIRSLRLGLTGIADVVEFHPFEETGSSEKAVWRPFPVEYKRGRSKKDNCDRVQLCAQALCLEEMLQIHIPEGALFYGKTRRRQNVSFDDPLRKETEDTARRLHELIASGQTPGAVYSKKCDSCSFIGLCLPKALGKGRSATGYLERMTRQI